jgi:hypothetical protein
MRDLSPTEQPAAARITVAFVGDDAIWSSTWTSTSAWSWDTNTLQYRRQLSTVMALSRRDHDRERPPLAVTSQVKLGGQPSTAPSEALVARMLDPFLHRPDWVDGAPHSHGDGHGLWSYPR